MPDALRDQKMASEPLELDIQMVMSCHVGSGGLLQDAWVHLTTELSLRFHNFTSLVVSMEELEKWPCSENAYAVVENQVLITISPAPMLDYS